MNWLNIDLKARLGNYMTYVGIIGIVFSAAGINFETLTSWALLGQALLSILDNPVSCVAVIVAVCGVICDTSTKGFNDGK